MTYKFPILPKSDDDFTPELARKIISNYQELVAIWKERHDLALQEIERLQDALRKIAHAPPGYGHGPTLSESIQIARKALGERE